MTYALGIDLGTTYTSAAVARGDGGRAEVVALGYRATAVPTVVALTEDGRLLVGDAAERRASMSPDRVAREFKRRVGDVTPLLLGGTPIAVDQCLASTLRWVHDTVAQNEGGPPAALTVTHPANWGEFKKDVLREALRLADLSGGGAGGSGAGGAGAGMLPEPAAAAVWYAQAERLAPGAVVAVYDLGGGTFDAAVLRRTAGGGFEALGRVEGIERLGGIDVDEAVFGHVLRTLGDDIGAAAGSGVAADPATTTAMAQLRRACVDAKEALSSETSITIPVWMPGLHTEVLLRRTELEELVAPLLEPSVRALGRVIASAGLDPGDVDAVLLIGGSSRMPLIGRQVSGGLGRPIVVDAHPKHPVALGAALDAASRLPTTAPPLPPRLGLAPPASTTTHLAPASPGPAGPTPASAGVPPNLAPEHSGGPSPLLAAGHVAPAPPGSAPPGPPSPFSAPGHAAPPPPPPRAGGRTVGLAVVAGVIGVVVVMVVLATTLLNGADTDGDGGDTATGSQGPGSSDDDGEHPADAPETEVPEARLAWQAELGEESTGPTATLDEERLYIADDQGNITAYSLAGGTQAWKVDLGEDASGTTPVRHGDVLLAGIGIPLSTFALDPATGEQRWKAPDHWLDPPLVAGDLVIGHSGSTLTALDLATGAVRWEVEDTLWSASDPVLAGDTVVIGSDDGRVSGVDPATGATRWITPLDRGDVDVEEIGVTSDAAVVVDEDQYVTMIDAATGAKRWTQELVADWSDRPHMVGDELIVSVEDGLAALDPATGAVRRTIDAVVASYAPLPGPVPALVVFDVQSLQAFDLEGRSLWVTDTPMDGLIMTVGPTAIAVHDYDGNIAVFTL